MKQLSSVWLPSVWAGGGCGLPMQDTAGSSAPPQGMAEPISHAGDAPGKMHSMKGRKMLYRLRRGEKWWRLKEEAL